MIHIGSNFDSGNVQVIQNNGPSDIRLHIRKDAGGVHSQWFHFRLTGAGGKQCRISLDNAGQTSYPKGWENYAAVASYNREYWFRVPTTYQDGKLIIQHRPKTDLIWYAYFAPYSHERHHRLIGQTVVCDYAKYHRLGATIDGNDLDMIQLGTPTAENRKLWLIARQHPGESMAEWWMEGFLHRMIDSKDALVRTLLQKGVFYIVPNMNPDGSIRGHLRCNAVGANLNREWQNPTVERSPEVLYTRNKMDLLGCDFCLDIHGDEALPYNFVAATEGIPSWTERLAKLTKQFQDAQERANPDFQQVHGYKKDLPRKANMTVCAAQIAQRFDCLAMTFEMPFKDNANLPEPIQGWSPERSKKMGASAVDAIAAVIDDLR